MYLTRLVTHIHGSKNKISHIHDMMYDMLKHQFLQEGTEKE